MLSLIRSRGSAGSLGAYGVTVPAVALGLWAALAIARTDARVLSVGPLALAVALSAAYGGVGPGLFALFQASLGIDFFLIEPGRLFHDLTSTQGSALILFIAGWSIFSLLTGAVVRQTHRIRQACDTAESASTHAARMTQLTSALAQARTPRAAIEAAVLEALYAMRANAGALLLVSSDDRTATVARAVGYPEGRIAEEVALSDGGPLADAVGRGVPVIIESRAARLAEYPPAAGQTLADTFQALAAAPLLIGSRVVAVLQLDFSQNRVFSQQDREYLLALAHGGAQALDRTWQLEVAERGRADAEHLRAQADLQLAERAVVEQALRASETRYRSLAARTSRLHALSAALSEAVTICAVARAVVTHGRTVVGATSAEVLLLAGEDTHLERLDAEPTDGVDSAEVRLDDGVCATAAVERRQPVFVASFEDWQRRFWRSASIAADGGYQSSATLPLLVEGAPIGVLAFHFTVPVNFDEDYQTLLVSVAQHCAQAIDRARLYESTQRARAEAERANRIKDEFVSIVSHELRTPLNAILGWTTMLQSGALPPEKSSRALRSVHENASRQARLIDELLDFSRVTSGRASLELEDVDMRDLIRGVAESMIPSAVARTVEIQLSPVPPVHVTGDRRRLEQVFFNLIDNALKFTPPGGRIAVDVRVGSGQVNVQVSDTGDGIDPDFLPHVFDRFRQADSTTSRTHGGLGLGMSIARQLVEAHDGQISAASEGRGCGSTFTVQLPTLAGTSGSAAQEPAAAASDETVRQEVRLDGLRVLVVDDEVDAREMMAAALESFGAEVQIAANTRSAVEILERTPVDVLLSDIAMPEEDGFALIRRVRGSQARHVAAIPAAAVTAFSGAEARDRALAAGFQLHLAKPLEPVELVRAVERLANRCTVQGA
jgi:signal transduction histidine kinase/CheY-like chemotaxis protein